MHTAASTIRTKVILDTGAIALIPLMKVYVSLASKRNPNLPFILNITRHIVTSHHSENLIAGFGQIAENLTCIKCIIH